MLAFVFEQISDIIWFTCEKDHVAAVCGTDNRTARMKKAGGRSGGYCSGPGEK